MEPLSPRYLGIAHPCRFASTRGYRRAPVLDHGNSLCHVMRGRPAPEAIAVQAGGRFASPAM